MPSSQKPGGEPSPDLKGYAGDLVEPGPTGELFLTCCISKSWVARRPATLTSAQHPGTAVSWGGNLFEVIEAAARPDGGMRYTLAAWDSRHAVRVVEVYDQAVEEKRRMEQERRLAAIRHRRASILLAPLLGLLPGSVQEKMEGDFGAPARAMTITSALPLLVLGIIGLLSSRIALSGGGIWFVPWLTLHPQVSVYLFAESVIRLGVAFLQGEPIGSLPGVLAYELWRTAAGRPAPVVSPPRRSRWKSGDTYRMFEPILALLAANEQEALETRYGFDPLKWGRRSAVAIAAVAVLNVVISLGALAQSSDTVWDGLWLVAGAFLLFEQVVRWRNLAAGHPAGSVLGVFVRPVARRLLAVPRAD